MKKNNLFILIIFGMLFLLNSCQSAREGFMGQKKNNSDEFLVEKKDPLVLPPDFDDLPEPKNSKSITRKDKSSNDSIKELLGAKEEDVTSESDANTNKSLENSIIKTLNDN